MRPSGPLRIGAGEHWCQGCGEIVDTSGVCFRCGSRQCVPAVAVLLGEEYFVAQ